MIYVVGAFIGLGAMVVLTPLVGPLIALIIVMGFCAFGFLRS